MSIQFNDHVRFAKISQDLIAGKQISKEDQQYGFCYVEDQYWYNTTNQEFQVVIKLLDNLRDASLNVYYIN